MLAQPGAALIAAADPTEVVLTQPEQGSVVEHGAGVVAHGGVDHLAHGELPHVAGQAVLQQRLRPRPEHLELAQRREIDGGDTLATCPVFRDRPDSGVAVGQPVAVVLDEVARKAAGAGVEAGFLGHGHVRIRLLVVTDGAREGFRLRIDAHVDVGGIPAVRRVDVVRASGRDADQIGQRPQQNVVAGARPRLVEGEQVLAVDDSVVEEVHGHPAAPGLNCIRLQGGIEVVRAVDVAGVAQVLVIPGGTSEAEGVVAHARILHQLHQRHEVLVDIFRPLPRMGIAEPHQRTGRGHIEAALDALVQPCPMKGLEVRALAPLDIDDLDPLAGADLVASGRSAVDPLVEASGGQGIGQHRLARRRGACGTLDEHHDRRWRVLPVGRHRRAGCRHDHCAGAARGVRLLLAGAALRPEQIERRGAGEVPVDAGGTVGDQPAEAGGASPCPLAQQAFGKLAVVRDADELADLTAFGIDEADDVPARDPHRARAPPRNDVTLHPRWEREQARPPHASRTANPTG